jgi:hypothetical protein
VEKDRYPGPILIGRESLHQPLLLGVREIAGAATRVAKSLELADRVRTSLVVADGHVEDPPEEGKQLLALVASVL